MKTCGVSVFASCAWVVWCTGPVMRAAAAHTHPSTPPPGLTFGTTWRPCDAGGAEGGPSGFGAGLGDGGRVEATDGGKSEVKTCH